MKSNQFKFTTLITLLSFCFLTPVFSQNFSAGLKSSVRFNTLSRSALDGSKVGFDAGIRTLYSNHVRMGVGMDLLFSRTGGDYDAREGLEVIQYDVRTDYLRFIPKAYLFFRNLEDSFRPKLTIGPSFGFLMGAYDSGINQSNKDDFESFEIGLEFGTGFNYKLTDVTWLTFDIDYLVGLNSINNESLTTPDEFKTNSLGVGLGVIIGI